jgi:hypothetical protein
LAEGDFLITRDPAYVLGMSTYTTRWSSCLAQPSGSHRRGVKFWVGLAGTSVAALLSDRTASHAGIERRVMRARYLAHHFRDGSKAFSSGYGDPESLRILHDWLVVKGYTPIAGTSQGRLVAGNVPRSQCGKPPSSALAIRPEMECGRKVWVALW